MAHRKHKKEKRNTKNDRLYIGLLIGILAFALIYSIIFVEGPSFFGDDTVYADLANSVLTGSFHQSPFIFSVRLLNIYPIAIFYKFFGVSLLTDSAWCIFSFLGIITVAFLLGKELHSNLAGIIAALLAAFFPLVVQISATVSDDIPMAFITSLAMLAILYAQRRSSRKWYLAAGILLIASPLVTPEGLIIIIVASTYLLIELARKKIRLDSTTIFLPIGMIVALVGLFAVNYATSGSVLVTFTTNANFYSAVGQQNTIPSTNIDPMFYIQNMFDYNIVQNIVSASQLGIYNPLILFQRIYIQNSSTVGFFFYTLVLAMIYLLIRFERRAYFVLLWFAAGFLYLEFGPMHVSLIPLSYLLSYRLSRFLAMIAIPTVVIIGIAMARMVGKRDNLRAKAATIAVPLAIAFLIGTSIPINLMWYHVMYAERYDQLVIAQYLNQLPNTTKIYFTGTFSNIHIYMQFYNMSRFYAYDSIQNCSAIPDGAYVIIPKYNQVFNLAYTPDPSKYCPGWQLVLSPQIDKNFSQDIINSAIPFRGNLYYVASNATSTTS
ncbi:MAG: ArnT family glycosyltransferase [Candidatus Micrarchaeales archaeon]